MDRRYQRRCRPAMRSRKRCGAEEASMARAVFMVIKTGLAVERSKGLRIQGVYGSALAHYALVQTQDALRVAIYHAEIVRNQKKSRSTFHLHAMEKRVDGVFEAGVHRRGRFIEQ